MDDLYKELGNPGRLQIIWFVMLACNLFTAAPNAVVGVFFGFSPAHYCNASLDVTDAAYIPQEPADKSLKHNLTTGGQPWLIYLSDSSNLTSRDIFDSVAGAGVHRSGALGRVQYGECSVNLTVYGSGSEQNVSRKCREGQWVYDLSEREATTVTDFDLVCERGYLTYLASMLYYLGLMLANMTLGYASDAVGRKPVVLMTIYLILLTGLGIAFANSFTLFVVLRVVMGVLSQVRSLRIVSELGDLRPSGPPPSQGAGGGVRTRDRKVFADLRTDSLSAVTPTDLGLQSAAFVLGIELFPVQHRGAAGSVNQVIWGLGCLYLSAVAWLARDWRLIQLCMLVPTALSALSLWYVGESPRWLLARGKTQRASLVVERIASFNKIDNPVEEKDHSHLSEYTVHGEEHSSSYLALVRTPQMRRRTLSLSVVLFGVNIGYFGMTYNNAELAGDKYLNFFLGSVAETVAYAFGAFVVVRYGRKRPLFVYLLSGSVCCLLSGVISRSGATNNVLVTIFSILGRFSLAACFCASDTFTAELFPTVVRSMGVGVCTFVARLGSTLAPLISALRTVTFSQLPPLVFAAFAFAGAMVILLLPETLTQDLPDTVDDVENNPRGKS
ncbi:solute carrier family 22 member 6-a [Plakobranchus ocellatus]|uniref:Solute carrier family 22 member 6-a n=1 Tax=Plakobranchus ocellatus TaxID=259542 RepID=A0AAV4CQC0_9GAST|nr:solute carrier family 22 member 6-a [Plakobranchus ocellatus]